jgi:HlyD family secretion protein
MYFKKMDTILKKKKWTTKKIATIAGAVIISLLIIYSYTSIGKNTAAVMKDRITIAAVLNDSFQEFIPVNGIVSPITTIYLDIAEGGRVEEKYAEDGALLKKGDPILKLANTDLELNLVNQQTNVYNLLTQMQISHNATQQNTITRLNQMAEVENAWQEASRIHQLNKQLYEQKAIGSQEFEQSKINYDYQVKRKKLTEQIINQDSISRKQETEQTKQSYSRTQEALRVMQQKVGDLVVRAPVDGQLTSLDAEFGQNKNKGERIGQIDVLSGFKVRADIDEHYSSRIFVGLTGEFVMNGVTYKMRIKKIFTQITNGRFMVDMEFVGAICQDLRRGQTLQVRLALGDETKAILLPRGGFYQQTGGNWIFKLSDDGKTAYRVDIQLGRQNPEYYEVLQGLKQGDKVITSNYDNYLDKQELKLND